MRILVVSLLLNVAMQTRYTSTYVTAEMIQLGRSSVNNAMDNIDVSTAKIPTISFGTENSTKIFAQSGSTALLPCVVHGIGEGTVTWIRRKNSEGHQLLTVGLGTYANDARFQATHFHHSEDWTLQIKYVQTRDAGTYECQVSTHPPTSIFLTLGVIEAQAEIVGTADKYVRPGSTLQLHCIVKQSTETPAYLFWFHNARMINYDSDQGVNVSTDLIAKESWLEVPKASDRHSGNYTCKASNALPARTVVHIFNGDNPAAMQHSLASLDNKYSTMLITIIWLSVFIIPNTFFY